jgi:hypothetical protein
LVAAEAGSASNKAPMAAVDIKPFRNARPPFIFVFDGATSRALRQAQGEEEKRVALDDAKHRLYLTLSLSKGS